MTDPAPTIIRRPTLSKAKAEAQCEIAAAESRGLAFSHISTGAIAGDAVITIYWRPADAG